MFFFVFCCCCFFCNQASQRNTFFQKRFYRPSVSQHKHWKGDPSSSNHNSYRWLETFLDWILWIKLFELKFVLGQCWFVVFSRWLACNRDSIALTEKRKKLRLVFQNSISPFNATSLYIPPKNVRKPEV